METKMTKTERAAFQRHNLRIDGVPFRLADGTVGFVVDLIHAGYPAVAAMRKIAGRWHEVQVSAYTARAAIAKAGL